MKGQIVHEWIEKFGGSEAVVAEMLQALAIDGVFCLWSDGVNEIEGVEIQESFLARTVIRKSKALAVLIVEAVWRVPRNPVLQGRILF